MTNILILDDDKMELTGLRLLVEQQRSLDINEIYCAGSVKEAKELVQKHGVDIALCDIEMPIESGIDFAKWMVSSNMDTDVIFVTGHAKFIYAAQAIQLHARGYLLKPVSVEDLEDNLISCFEYRKATKKQKHLSAETEEDEVIRKTKKYIREHLNENITRKDISQEVFLHPDYVSSIFHKKTGSTLSDYIITERIELAKKLLRDTQDSISEAAIRSGFSNTSYFSKIFKRLEGMTPKQYRERN